MRYYIVDAFTDELFKGNQAGVCLLDGAIGAELMQSIAAENNLSETAFVVRQDGYYDLRWFTPEIEVDLCGHATLASAFVILGYVEKHAESVKFHTQSGILTVRRTGELLEMDFPSRKPVSIPITPLMEEAIGVPVLEAGLSTRDMLLQVESEQQVRKLRPNMSLISQLPDCMALIVTAAGESTEKGSTEIGEGSENDDGSENNEGSGKGEGIDFVSRFFAPKAGIDEDPVTGSSHSTLIPYWAEKLGKDKLIARQLSKRGGTLYCENYGERVKIAGKAVLYLEGEIRAGRHIKVFVRE